MALAATFPAERWLASRGTTGIGHDHAPNGQGRWGHPTCRRVHRADISQRRYHERDIATIKAAALGCELTYALVPKRPLREILEERAERIARDEVSRVKHSIAREDQSTGPEHLEREISELQWEALRRQTLSRLWQMRSEYASCATPIDLDEAKGIIPAHLTLKRELTEYEESTILEATALVVLRDAASDPLDERFIHVAVHRRMFNQTGKWAGKSRRTDKNIGVSWFEIYVRLRQMLGDVRAQIEYQAYAPVEIAARFHHRLVAIHVFPNGNGRHARLMADLLLTELAGRRFEWGRGSQVAANELRARYISALQAADAGDCQPLLDFLDNA